jgi:hypothetical protein
MAALTAFVSAITKLLTRTEEKMEKHFMTKINNEIEKLAKKYSDGNEVIEFNLEYDLNAFSLMVIQEYRRALSDKDPYSLPDEVIHG